MGSRRRGEFFKSFCCLLRCISMSVLCLCKMIHHLSLNAQVFELPENAGIPVGGEDSDIFYRLEILYNNPNQETGK